MEVFPDEPVMPTIVRPPATSFGGHRGGQPGQRGEHRRARAVGVVLENAGRRVGPGLGIGLDDDRGHPDGPCGQHRDGAGCHRRGREVVAVRTRAGQREEQSAGTVTARESNSTVPVTRVAGGVGG